MLSECVWDVVGYWRVECVGGVGMLDCCVVEVLVKFLFGESEISPIRNILGVWGVAPLV